MADGTTLGTAYVQIIPSMEGTSATMTSYLSSEGKTAGEKAGKETGSGFASKFNDALSSKSLSTISTLLKDTGSKISEVGGTLTKNLTVPLTAFGTAAIAAFKTYDDGADTIIQKTGASGEALEAMEESMKSIAQTIPVSFGDAGSAIGEVNTRFGLTGDALEELSQQFLEFAELNGTDVSNSIDVVQKAMAAYGVSAEDAGAMLDTLNKVGQDTGINVDTLASSMTSNAQSLKEMGLSASDAATLIGTLEKTGIDTSTVMVGMKKVLAEAVESGTSGQEAFAKAISSSEEAVSIFGSKAGPMLYSAFQDGTLSVEMFEGGLTSLQDNLGNVSDTYESTLDPIDQWQITLNNILPLLADIGNSIMSALQPALEGLCTVIQNVTSWWNSLDDGTKNLIATITLVLAAVGPVVSVIGTIISGIGSLIGVVGMILNPIGLVVTAVVGVVAVLYSLYNSNEDVRNFIDTCWNAISTTISTVVSTISAFLTDAWNVISQTVTTVWTTISTTFSTVWENLSNIVSTTITTIKNVISTVFTAISTTISNVWNTVKSVTSSVWNGISSTISGIINTIKSVISTVFNAVKSTISNIWNGIKSTTSSVWNGIKSAIETPINKAKDIVKSVIDTIKGFFNFNISWPNIPMPHFSIKPSGWKIGDLLKGSIPSLGISWYAKAMDEPYMLSKATLIGAGEKGDEVIYGHSQLMSDIREAVSEKGSSETNQRPIYINVYAKDQDEKKIAKEVSDLLNKQMLRGAF